mgnify:CR=1 FL=1
MVVYLANITAPNLKQPLVEFHRTLRDLNRMEAQKHYQVADATQRVGANAIGHAGLAALAGEEEGSRLEQISGRRCT